MADVIERIGYDAARLGSLSAGRLLEPGGPVFGASLGRAEFELALRAQAALSIRGPTELPPQREGPL